MTILLAVIAGGVLAAIPLAGLSVAGIIAQLSAGIVLAAGMTLNAAEIENYRELGALRAAQPWYRLLGPADVVGR